MKNDSTEFNASEVQSIWNNHKFCWKKADSWVPQLSEWLKPKFKKDWIKRLRPGKHRDICWDDDEWLKILNRCIISDIEYLVEMLADAIEYSIIRTFHGCRTDDVASYFKHGLRIHNRDTIRERLLTIIASNPELELMRSNVDSLIAKINNSEDIGCLFVVADDAVMIDRAAHYLIYGSEWVTSVLGEQKYVLKKTGIPTLIEIDLPLRMVGQETRIELAIKMLSEWVRQKCNLPKTSAPIDFSFILNNSIPASWVIGHTHPAEMRDHLLEGRSVYKSPNTVCAYCSAKY